MKHIIWIIALVSVAAGCATDPRSPPTQDIDLTQQPGQTIQALEELDGLRAELATLRNEVEIQRNELDKLQRRQRELYDDLDYRLRERERTVGRTPPATMPGMVPGQGGVAAPGGTPPAGPAAGAGPAASVPGAGPPPIGGAPPVVAAGPAVGAVAPQVTPPGQTGGVPEYTGPQTQVEAAGAGPAPAAAGSGWTASAGDAATATPPPQQVAAVAPPAPQQAQTVSVASAAEQTAYDSAFELLKQSRYGEAVEAFRSVILQYPDGVLADDAQYWSVRPCM